MLHRLAIGQVSIATINAIASWIMMSLVGIPASRVLAVAVGFLGLIPMVGATSGPPSCAWSPSSRAEEGGHRGDLLRIAAQQTENYVFAPRIMQRTVSVPGAANRGGRSHRWHAPGVSVLLAIPVAAGLLLLYDEVSCRACHS